MKPKIIFFGSDKYSKIVLETLKKDKRFRLVKNLVDKPDVGVLASYGKILPPEVLAIPKHGILNIHPSLLPAYRGPTPVQTAVLNNERQTGVTIIKIDEKVDHGLIVAQFSEEILSADTAERLYFRLFFIGAEVLKTVLPAYLEGRIELREQDHAKATYTKKFTREDGKIDWKKPLEFIERQIRAFYPWPGSWTEIHLRGVPQAGRQTSLPRLTAAQHHLGGVKRLKILEAHLENGKLVLDKVQLEGKKPVSWKQFCEGYPGVKIGD